MSKQIDSLYGKTVAEPWPGIVIDRRAVSHWRDICGYHCAMNELNEILFCFDDRDRQLFLWKPRANGLDAIPYCKISRFRNGYKSGSIVVR